MTDLENRNHKKAMLDFKQAEIELTSHCNAACPGCKRTQLLIKKQPFPLAHLDEQILFSCFSKINLKNFALKLYGALGDPLLHPKILDVIEWFLERDAKIIISTNGSLRSESWWRSLGHLSAKTQRLNVAFAVDGLEDTNPIYRVKTNFEIISRNMRAYALAKGLGEWVFIEFDHNIHQKDQARKMAQSMGLDFYVKRATRNIKDLKLTHKNNLSQKIQTISTKNSTPHREAGLYNKITNNQISVYDPHSINCTFYHGKKFFIACDGTVWPCCYLWDEYLKKENFYKTVSKHCPAKGWNSIYENDLENIFSNVFYMSISDLWKETSLRFEKRCYKSCGAKGLLRDSFSKQ